MPSSNSCGPSMGTCCAAWLSRKSGGDSAGEEKSSLRLEVRVKFLSLEDVVAIHDNTLRHEGGLMGLRDPGLLESAVLMPQQQFGGSYLHEDVAAMAAAYLFHICSNHPFVDGNKRTAVLASLVFLAVNGVERFPAPEGLERMTMGLAAGEIDKGELTGWMRTTLVSESGS